MNIAQTICMTILGTALLIGCSGDKPPVDSRGKTPQQVLIDTYTLVIQGKLSEARDNFAPQFIEEMITKNESTFEEYSSHADGWKVSWLKTKVMGNDYNDDIWRVKIIPDQGKGEHNGPGVVQDLYMIDGKWKIVFWGHYPKS